MYRKTMALRSNPFGPTFEKTPENLRRLAYLTNLDRNPLRLDQHQDLNRLFCRDILGLDKIMANFHQLMMKLNYKFDGNGERGLESVLVVIRRSIGAGKTTLGAWMIAEIARRARVGRQRGDRRL